MASPSPDLLAVERAVRALDPEPVLLRGTDPAALAAQVAAAPPGAVVGALGVLDLLDHLAPLLDALRAAAEAGATVVLTVPNTPYTGVGRAWSEGAVEELRSLLPAGHRLLHAVPLAGAALVEPGEEAAFAGLEARVRSGAVASTAVLAFGPRAGELATVAAVAAVDLAAERAERRRLEADNAFLTARVAELEAASGGRPGAAPADGVPLAARVPA
jgi:hypothetical protein